jgi:putative ABC transport system substrate-binding protein
LTLRRRQLIALLGGVAVTWPIAARAQQPGRVRRVGVLIGFPENSPESQAFVTAFTQALGRLGWVEGKNIQLHIRFAAGDPTLFKSYAAELVGLLPDAILASTAAAVLPLREQTHTIPIVFVIVPDPVGLGLVHSLAQPGGNITGFTSYDSALVGKWLQLLKELATSVTRVAIIFNPDTGSVPSLDPVIEAGPSLGVTVKLAPVHDDAEIEAATAALAREPGGGLIIKPDSFNVTHRDVIIAAAARHSLPLISFDITFFPRAGGLLSYWFDAAKLHAEAASYIDRILRGASPADLPVQYPTKYSLIINLKTAKALGLTVPPSMLDLADEVIE